VISCLKHAMLHYEASLAVMRVFQVAPAKDSWSRTFPSRPAQTHRRIIPAQWPGAGYVVQWLVSDSRPVQHRLTIRSFWLNDPEQATSYYNLSPIDLNGFISNFFINASIAEIFVRIISQYDWHQYITKTRLLVWFLINNTPSGIHHLYWFTFK